MKNPKNNTNKIKKNQAGFTMAEVLVTVAVLVILFAIAVPAVFKIQKDLRQKELDSKAESIYQAAQNQLTNLYASGRSMIYDPGRSSREPGVIIEKLGDYPGDYVPTTGSKLNSDSVYYFTSSNQEIDQIITNQNLDDDLAHGHWVIEYIPYAYHEEEEAGSTALTAAKVYAVYYSEDKVDAAEEYYNSGNGPLSTNYYKTLRSKQHRLEQDARVGYYGGAASAGSDTNTLTLENVKIHSNEEILTATGICKKPVAINQPLRFQFDLSDAEGHRFTVYYDESKGSGGSFLTEDGFLYQKNNITIQKTGDNYYEFEMVLDDLSKNESRFNQLYGSESGDGRTVNEQLIPGLDITLKVTVSCPEEHAVASVSASDNGNSLFGYLSEQERAAGAEYSDVEPSANKALLLCGRHLQNLDESSHVTSQMNQAYQIADISFSNPALNEKTTESSKKSWYETYVYDESKKQEQTYFNNPLVNGKQQQISVPVIRSGEKKNEKAANFKPIANPYLISFDVREKNAKKDNTEQEEQEQTGKYYVIRGLCSSNLGDEAESAKNLGLFAYLGNGQEDASQQVILSHIRMTGPRLVSKDADAGALIGQVKAGQIVTIDNCQVYLEEKMDYPSSIDGEKHLESSRQITGKRVGGLIGYTEEESNLLIRNSSASLVLGTPMENKAGNQPAILEYCAGGLIGSNGANLTIEKSYADCYIYGDQIGGLVGRTDRDLARIQDAYTAGYLALYSKNGSAAALVNGDIVQAENLYTIMACYRTDSKGVIDQEEGRVDTPGKGIYYSTARSISKLDGKKGVYYFDGGSSDNYNVKDTLTIKNFSKTELKALLGNNFEINTVGTRPYNLMGQSLTTYTYPRIKKLDHYGDWQAQFQSGALVYYEKYQKENGQIYYGFEGAGVAKSLSEKDDILGDGYGIAFVDNSSSSEVRVEIDGQPVSWYNRSKGTWENHFDPNQGEEGKDYYKVTRKENGQEISYRIYPLNKEVVNPGIAVKGYYARVEISQAESLNSAGNIEQNAGSQSNEDDKKASVIKSYYDFNPHFARTILEKSSEEESISPVPESISIRSPRHLYNLSLHYDNVLVTDDKGNQFSAGYKKYVGDKVVYQQERNLDYPIYEWKNFTRETENVDQQEPIGRSKDNRFTASYDGGCYRISRVSFVSRKGTYLGLFGRADGVLKNIVLATDYNRSNDAKNYRVQRTEPAQTNSTVYYGILAGYNEGSINNCAAAGYYLSGKDGTIYGYANSEIYVGGLVGWNAGNIKNSEADSPRMRLSMLNASCYAGGFAGWNQGNISYCYALNHIDAYAKKGDTKIAGFAGENSGNISYSYCATALTAAGNGTTSYPFTTKAGGGKVRNCYYLHAGSYLFVDGLYAYDHDTSNAVASYKTYAQLKNMVQHRAAKSYNHRNTTELGQEEDYPYNAVVKNAKGNYVHYGEWQVAPELGTLGIFYWEYESSGENTGYKLTFIGTSEGKSQYQTTLCASHDDGGIISEYGYGYYVLQGDESQVTYSLKDLTTSGDKLGNNTYKAGKVNTAAKNALQSQMPGYTFYPYTTSGGADANASYISLNKSHSGVDGSNGQMTLHYKDADYTYTISPFFANAMAYTKGPTLDGRGISSMVIEDAAGNVTDYAYTTPGQNINGKTNQYEIRNLQQLQYINWNYETKNASTMLTSSNKDKFNYLVYATQTGSKTSRSINDVSGTEDSREASKLLWRQSHDLTHTGNGTFYPIASTNSTSSDSNYDAVLYGWFGGSYDGQSYMIKNVQISSPSFNVGLFGTTAGANLENIIMYSDNNSVIERRDASNVKGAYSIGALVGVAYDYNVDGAKNSDRYIRNCATSGYIVRDSSSNKQTLGESNVGGMFGVSAVNMSHCTAANTIDLNCSHENGSALWGIYIRVGGISGGTQGYVENCYSGGKILIQDKTLTQYSLAGASSGNKCYKIYLGGISGSAFTVSYQNFVSGGVKEGSPTFKNCYSYTQFPSKYLKDQFESKNKAGSLVCELAMYPVASMADRTQAAAGTGKKVTIDNCYYLDRIAHSGVQEVYTTFINYSTLGQNNYPGTTVGTPVSKTYQEMSSATFVGQLGGVAAGWGKVTKIDAAGGRIDGKYSFPGSERSLRGKNYPFPTVITQEDLTFKGNQVNVHFGSWPIPGAYWEDGEASMDIFQDMEEDGWAYQDFTFQINGDSDLRGKTLSEKDFSVLVDLEEDANVSADEGIGGKADSSVNVSTADTGRNTQGAGISGQPDGNLSADEGLDGLPTDGSISDKAVIDGVTKNSDDSYTVRVKALKKGTVFVKEETSGAIFTLNITAKLVVTADPDSMTLASKEGKDLILAARSEDLVGEDPKDYSIAEELSWTVTSNEDSKGNPYVDVSTKDKIEEHKNQYLLTGLGRDAIVQCQAAYDYHGEIFTDKVLVNVQRAGIIGLSDHENYCESGVEDAEFEGEKEATAVTYSSTSTDKPDSQAVYFLYDTALAGLLEDYVDGNGVKIETNAVSASHPEILIQTALSKNLDNVEGNDFQTLGISLYYKTNHPEIPELTDIDLEIRVIKEKASYILRLANVKVQAQWYNLILDANGGKLYQPDEKSEEADQEDALARDTIEIPMDQNISQEMLAAYGQAAEKTGYDFAGWNTKPDGSGLQTNAVNPADYQQDLTLYAIWESHSYSVKILDTEAGSEEKEIQIRYDAKVIDMAQVYDGGIPIMGLYDSREQDAHKIIDKDGKVTDQDKLQKILLSANPSLYLQTGYTLTLAYGQGTQWQAVDIMVRGDERSLPSDQKPDVGNRQDSHGRSWTFTGWTRENGQLAINAQGQYLDGFSVNQDITLYARWSRQAYVPSSDITDGRYLIANSINKGSNRLAARSANGWRVVAGNAQIDEAANYFDENGYAINTYYDEATFASATEYIWQITCNSEKQFLIQQISYLDRGIANKSDNAGILIDNSQNASLYHYENGALATRSANNNKAYLYLGSSGNPVIDKNAHTSYLLKLQEIYSYAAGYEGGYAAQAVLQSEDMMRDENAKHAFYLTLIHEEGQRQEIIWDDIVYCGSQSLDDYLQPRIPDQTKELDGWYAYPEQMNGQPQSGSQQNSGIQSVNGEQGISGGQEANGQPKLSGGHQMSGNPDQLHSAVKVLNADGSPVDYAENYIRKGRWDYADIELTLYAVWKEKEVPVIENPEPDENGLGDNGFNDSALHDSNQQLIMPDETGQNQNSIYQQNPANVDNSSPVNQADPDVVDNSMNIPKPPSNESGNESNSQGVYRNINYEKIYE